MRTDIPLSSAYGLGGHKPGFFLRVVHLLKISTLLLSFTGCNYIAEFACKLDDKCSVINNVFVVGGTEKQQALLSSRVKEASENYRLWSGRAAPKGLIRLDKRVVIDNELLNHARWSFTYDRDRAPHFGLATASGIGEPVSLRRQGLALSTQTDFPEDHVISHEICHKYASHLSSQTWGGKSVIPDAVNEISAISCEPRGVIINRILEFSPFYIKGDYIPWSGFLRSPHPLKDSSLMKGIMDASKKTKSKHLLFSFERESELGMKIEGFYGQSATMALFLKTRPCKRKSAIGLLITEYNSELGISRWLALDECLPQDPNELDREMKNIILLAMKIAKPR